MNTRDELERQARIFENRTGREIKAEIRIYDEIAADMREQIRLLDTITLEAQAAYFDPRTDAERDLDQWQAETEATRRSERP
jgi:hypothetical protein